MDKETKVSEDQCFELLYLANLARLINVKSII